MARNDPEPRKTAQELDQENKERRLRQFASRHLRDLLGIRVTLTNGVVLEFGTRFYSRIDQREETGPMPLRDQDDIAEQIVALRRRLEQLRAEGYEAPDVEELNLPADLADMRFPEWDEISFVFREP